jgi:hypothetical protein
MRLAHLHLSCRAIAALFSRRVFIGRHNPRSIQNRAETRRPET